MRQEKGCRRTEKYRVEFRLDLRMYVVALCPLWSSRCCKKKQPATPDSAEKTESQPRKDVSTVLCPMFPPFDLFPSPFLAGLALFTPRGVKKGEKVHVLLVDEILQTCSNMKFSDLLLSPKVEAVRRRSPPPVFPPAKHKPRVCTAQISMRRPLLYSIDRVKPTSQPVTDIRKNARECGPPSPSPVLHVAGPAVRLGHPIPSPIPIPILIPCHDFSRTTKCNQKRCHLPPPSPHSDQPTPPRHVFTEPIHHMTAFLHAGSNKLVLR